VKLVFEFEFEEGFFVLGRVLGFGEICLVEVSGLGEQCCEIILLGHWIGYFYKRVGMGGKLSDYKIILI
jgi:hypothetical protein